MKDILYFGILTLSVVLLLTSVICNICIHLHCKKLSRAQLQTGISEASGLHIEMTGIHNRYTINEEGIRQEDNGVQSQGEIQNTNASSSSDSDDQSSSAADETGLRESSGYLNPYCTRIENTADVNYYETISSEKFERDIADVNFNAELERSYENLKY